MKRIKSDQINSIICQYMKRRRFMDGADPAHRKERKDQGLHEMALQRIVTKKDSCIQAVSYSSINGDAHAYEQQYNRFKGFVHDSCSLHRESLDDLMYPLFVHMYLDMLCNGQKTAAHKFYSRYSGQYITSEYSDTVNELELMYSKEDIIENKNIQEFRDHKYVVRLSNSAMEYLQRYLKQDENVLVLQMFNRFIDIKVQGCQINQDLFQHGDRDLEGLEPVSQPCTPENKVIQDEVTLSGLQDCMTKIRNGPPTLPSVCMYTLLNAFQGLCSASFSSDENLLVGGFEDSSLRVWNLKPRYTTEISPSESESKQGGESESIISINHVHLSGDFPDDVSNKMKLQSCSADGSSVLRGHYGPVYSTSFTRSSSHILSASEDTTVRLWDLQSSQCKVCYRGHSYPVWCVDSSPVCDYFASCSQDNTVRLWSTDRIYPQRTFNGHTADVNVVQFHPNGTYLASGSSDRTVRMWSIQEGKCVRLFQGHKSGIYCLAFSPDGHMLASAGEDRRIRLWDLSSGTLFKELKGHNDIIYSLCFNRDSSVLASGGMDATLRLWDVRKDITPSNTQETFSSPELLGAFSTKSACVHKLIYSKKNYILSVGALCS